MPFLFGGGKQSKPLLCHEIVNGHLRFKSQGQTEENYRVCINHEQNELVTSIWERKRP